MNPDILPLSDIFLRLRRDYRLSLGLNDYFAVLRAIESGIGIDNQQALKQLCCLIWAKSQDDVEAIQAVLAQTWSQLDHPPSPSYIEVVPEVAPPILFSASENADQDERKDNRQKEEKSTERQREALSIDQKSIALETNEPVEIVQAVRSESRSRKVNPPPYRFLTEYFPVTRRQMKQIWRCLRNPVREGASVEFDIDSTVAHISRTGVLLHPILVPPRRNRTELLLLIDMNGSMTPFHSLSRQLVETAQAGGRLRSVLTYYFHNCPSELLYKDPRLLESVSISDAFSQVSLKTVALVLSDAGAARSTYNKLRTHLTQKFVNDLNQSVRHSAWLNPMPDNDWLNTTAQEIAQIVPMFEMSRLGMGAAVNVLQGRYIQWEKRYSWLNRIQ